MRNNVQKIKSIIAGMLLMLGVGTFSLALATPSFAAVDPQAQVCKGTGGSGGANGCSGNTNTADLTTVFKTVVNVLLYIIGAIAVIMIIVGAVRFTTSSGNASSVTAAKNTILYAIVGLVIAIFAYAIVNFVIGAF